MVALKRCIPFLLLGIVIVEGFVRVTPRREGRWDASLLMAKRTQGKQKPPRFTQTVHNERSKINKDKMWKSGKSIEELEQSMTQRWGTSLEKWTSEDHFEDDDDDFVVVGETTTEVRTTPVADPWSEQEDGRRSVQRKESIFGRESDADPALRKVQRNQQRLRTGQKNNTSFIQVDRMIASKPAGGRGTNNEEESGGYFFRSPPERKNKSNTPQIQEPEKTQRRPSVEKESTLPLLDGNGNPLFLTLKQAEAGFCEQVGEEPVLFDEEAEAFRQNSATRSWNEMGISNSLLLENLEHIGCGRSLPVQDKACPLVLKGDDVLVGTYTGSGKTLSFLVPLIQRILDEDDGKSNKVLKVLIVAPGRELASQIVSVARELLDGSEHSAMLAIGGTTYGRNLEQIRKRRPSILVGTPGRIAELVVGRSGERRGSLKVADLQYMVLDEFDALLEYKAHRDPTNAIIDALKRRHGDNLQSIACSATATDMLDSPKLARLFRPGFSLAMADDNDVLVTEGNKKGTRVSRTVIHGVVHVPHPRLALETLRRILHTDPLPRQVLIFADNSRKVKIVCEKLENMGIIAAPLHGGMGSEKMDRAEVSKALREGYVGIVVATEMAARGLDAPLLTHVINLDLPTDASHYAHRAGRCGRGGRPGVVVNLTTNSKERKVPNKLSGQLGVDLHTVEVRNGKLNIVDPNSLTID